MTIARRAVMQALAGTPFMGPAVVESAKASAMKMLAGLPAGMNHQGNNAPSSYGEPKGMPMPIKHPLLELLGQDGLRVLYEHRDALERERHHRLRARANGVVDVDLRAMKSLSPSYRDLKQRERDTETNDLVSRVERALRW